MNASWKKNIRCLRVDSAPCMRHHRVAGLELKSKMGQEEVFGPRYFWEHRFLQVSEPFLGKTCVLRQLLRLKFPTVFGEAAAEAFEDAPFGAQGGRGWLKLLALAESQENICRSKVFYQVAPSHSKHRNRMQLHQVLTQLRRQCLAGEDTSVGSTQHWQGTVLSGRMSCFHLFLGGCLGISWWIRLEVWHRKCWFKVMIDPKVLATASYSLLYHGSWGSYLGHKKDLACSDLTEKQVRVKTFGRLQVYPRKVFGSCNSQNELLSE